MPEEDKKEDTKKTNRGGLGIVLPLVILAGVGIWFWANHRDEPSASQSGRVRSTLHLETFVLNLADPDQRSYLRVGIDLGLNHEARHGEELAPVGQVRDAILG